MHFHFPHSFKFYLHITHMGRRKSKQSGITKSKQTLFFFFAKIGAIHLKIETLTMGHNCKNDGSVRSEAAMVVVVIVAAAVTGNRKGLVEVVEMVEGL
ncbi:hypothetical protein MtrunA17_Chr1g0192981 [Medicago truncatula]|uniref:Uncharacterized protein n=1 Tax=Medicago truncatula TaxID=3880 RepID=A0A396JXF2_MEDTR|nr:hypothetical protein MtrunA17_Chr1g0192981 [Medicago truncatula]